MKCGLTHKPMDAEFKNFCFCAVYYGTNSNRPLPTILRALFILLPPPLTFKKPMTSLSRTTSQSTTMKAKSFQRISPQSGKQESPLDTKKPFTPHHQLDQDLYSIIVMGSHGCPMNFKVPSQSNTNYSLTPQGDITLYSSMYVIHLDLTGRANPLTHTHQL